MRKADSSTIPKNSNLILIGGAAQQRRCAVMLRVLLRRAAGPSCLYLEGTNSLLISRVLNDTSKVK